MTIHIQGERDFDSAAAATMESNGVRCKLAVPSTAFLSLLKQDLVFEKKKKPRC